MVGLCGRSGSTDGPLMHFIVLSMTMSQFRVGSYEFGVEQ